MKWKLREYMQLTKPTILLLVLITGATALVMEGSMVAQPLRFMSLLFALFCVGGSANAFNQYLEREQDAAMTRTAKKRPLPSGRLAPAAALRFAIALGCEGVFILGWMFNWLSAGLALGTILFYSFFYTLWLKPRTHLNIVIGGAAGAMGPLIAWAAATNSLAMTPWLLFMIIFLWTPPHFWALALCLKEDYKRIGYPMMPLVKGDRETLRQILLYTLALVAISLSLLAYKAGLLYMILALVLGSVFVWMVLRLQKTGNIRHAWGLFGYSIVYLLTLFVGLMIDAKWNWKVIPALG